MNESLAKSFDLFDSFLPECTEDSEEEDGEEEEEEEEEGVQFDLFDAFFDERSTKEKEESEEGLVCPVCNKKQNTKDEQILTRHVEECLSTTFIAQEIQGNPSRAPANPVPASRSSSASCEECGIFDGHLTHCSQFRRGGGNSSSHSIQHPDIYNSPLSITCPYYGCQQRMEAFDFQLHVNRVHIQEQSHAYSCPVCSLQGYHHDVNDSTNLLNHVNSVHYREDDYVYNPTDFGEDKVPMLKKVGTQYVEDILKKEMLDRECTICYEDIVAGQVIYRMDCLCVFHKDCLSKWFKRSRCCPLHTTET